MRLDHVLFEADGEGKWRSYREIFLDPPCCGNYCARVGLTCQELGIIATDLNGRELSLLDEVSCPVLGMHQDAAQAGSGGDALLEVAFHL